MFENAAEKFRECERIYRRRKLCCNYFFQNYILKFSLMTFRYMHNWNFFLISSSYSSGFFLFVCLLACFKTIIILRQLHGPRSLEIYMRKYVHIGAAENWSLAQWFSVLVHHWNHPRSPKILIPAFLPQEILIKLVSVWSRTWYF